MQRDIYLQSRHRYRDASLAKHEKAFGILTLTLLLIGTISAGALLLFDFALPLLGRVWRTTPLNTKQELVEACVLFGAMGTVLFCGWARAKRPRDLAAMAITIAIIMPAFALGYSQVSDLWRSILRVMLAR
jgi:hypothetical protein